MRSFWWNGIIFGLVIIVGIDGLTRKVFANSVTQKPEPIVDSFSSDLQLLGEGNYGRVSAVQKLGTDRYYARKRILKSMVHEKQSRVENLDNEIAIHYALLGSRNLVGFEGWYEDADYYYIVSELCAESLFDKLVATTNGVDESTVKGYMWEITHGIKSMHEKGFLHRDLKLENVLIDKFGNLKIGDFGFAMHVNGQTTAKTVGSDEYIAPEALRRRPYSLPVDIWALGVIFYTLLFKAYPFYGSTSGDIYNKAIAGVFEFPSNIEISIRCKDLINKLLVTNPQKRWTIDEVLAHPWFDDVRKESAGAACTDVANTDGASTDMASTNVAGISKTVPKAPEKIKPAGNQQDPFGEVSDNGLTCLLI